MEINPTIASQIITGLVLAGIVWERVGSISERLDRLEGKVSDGLGNVRDSVDALRGRVDDQNHRLTDLEREREHERGVREGMQRRRDGGTGTQ